jgi:hypothetical protein
MATPLWYAKIPWDAVHKICDDLDLDADLVAAMIMTESGGDHLAVRFEPKWRAFVTPEIFCRTTNITFDTEKFMQACSFGVLQVMGAVARECGFVGPILGLADMETGLLYGCKKLKKCLAKYDEVEAICAYNCGTPMKTPAGKYTNQDYLDKVHGYLKELELPQGV